MPSIPDEFMLAGTKNSVASVLHISERSCTQQHLKHDILAVDLYDCITGDSQERNTVLPPATELSVSVLLIVYCMSILQD